MRTIRLMFAFLLATIPALGAEGFTPRVKVGDRWVVEAIYYQPWAMAAHGGFNDPAWADKVWSRPFRWAYEVVGEEEISGKRAYKVAVREEKNLLQAAAELYLRADDFKIVRVVIAETIRGEKFVRRADYTADAPVKTDYSVIPYDMPFFPLAESKTESVTQVSRFQAVRRLSADTAFAQRFEQKVTAVSSNDVGGLLKMPEASSKRTLLQVEIVEDDRLAAKQLWDSRYPWPLYSEGQFFKAWLVAYVGK